METKPLLFSRSLSFASQQKLLTWLSQQRQTDLNRVKDLTLRLTDVELSQILGNDSQSVWSLYSAHLAEMQIARKRLPSLRKLTLVPPKSMHSTLLRGFYLSLLAMIPKIWPGLKLLILHDDEDVLKAVPSLSEVAKVEFVPTAKSNSDARKGRTLRQLSKERKVGGERVDSPMAGTEGSETESEHSRMVC